MSNRFKNIDPSAAISVLANPRIMLNHVACKNLFLSRRTTKLLYSFTTITAKNWSLLDIWTSRARPETVSMLASSPHREFPIGLLEQSC
jgi:hypothetical protein